MRGNLSGTKEIRNQYKLSEIQLKKDNKKYTNYKASVLKKWFTKYNCYIYGWIFGWQKTEVKNKKERGKKIIVIENEKLKLNKLIKKKSFKKPK